MSEQSFETRGDTSAPPITFDFSGTEFAARGWVPGASILDVETAILSGNDGLQAEAIWRFMREALSADCTACGGTGGPADDPCKECGGDGLNLAEYRRFRDFTGNRKNRVHLWDLLACVRWLEGRYGSRPTQPSEPSPLGQQSSESGSTAAAP